MKAHWNKPPEESDADANALNWAKYAMVSSAILYHVHNVDRDMDAAAEVLVDVEAAMKQVEKGGSDFKAMAKVLRADHTAMRKTIGANRIALAYENLSKGIRRGMTSKAKGVVDGDSPATKEKTTKETKPDIREYKVTTDARAKERGDQIDASGRNTIVIKSAEGQFTVNYSFSYPSHYLTTGGGDLTGKTVKVEYRDGKPSTISCGSGSGKCPIQSMEKVTAK